MLLQSVMLWCVVLFAPIMILGQAHSSNTWKEIDVRFVWLEAGEYRMARLAL